jgi:Cupredoxin-like domain
MRSHQGAAIGLAVMAMAGACSSAAAPASSTESVPSIVASASPSQVSSLQPSSSALVLHLMATFILAGDVNNWAPTILSAPADEAFQIAMKVPGNNTYNLWIEDASGKPLFQGGDQVGYGTKTYDIPALKAGTYSFVCTYYPRTMTGTLTVH